MREDRGQTGEVVGERDRREEKKQERSGVVYLAGRERNEQSVGYYKRVRQDNTGTGKRRAWPDRHVHKPTLTQVNTQTHT